MSNPPRCSFCGTVNPKTGLVQRPGWGTGTLICAECYQEHYRIADEGRARLQAIATDLWAVDAIQCLRDAVAGKAHWRSDARAIIRSIDQGIPPEPMSERKRERLREIDARKRAAEITADIMEDEHA